MNANETKATETETETEKTLREILANATPGGQPVGRFTWYTEVSYEDLFAGCE